MKKEKTKYKGIKRIGQKEYEVRIRWKDPKTGKPRDQKRICKGTVEDAHQMQLELQAEVADGGTQQRMTLGECGKLWFEQHVVGLKPGTVKRYGEYLKRIFAVLGDHFLDALTPMDVQAFQTHELQLSYSRATIRGSVGLLRQISRFAIANRIIAYDFTAGVTAKGPIKTYTVDEPNSLTPPQLRAFLACAEEHEPMWYAPLFVLACTGMRVGEVMGLSWDDIDFAGKKIMIRRTNSLGRMGAPKTAAGRRHVAMPDGLREVLQAHRASLVAQQHPSLHSGWVFSKPDGKPFSRNVFSEPVARIKKALGLPFRFTPHGLRRTFNSMLRQSAPDRVVMATLGHRNLAMTEHYTTIYDDEKLEASTNVLKLVTAPKREDLRESRPICSACGQEIMNDSNELPDDDVA